MPKFSFRRACLIFFLLPASFANANDTTASLKVGGLVVKKTKNLAMESEDLRISPSEISVKYVFRNLTHHDIKTTVAFPLPQIVSESEIVAYSELENNLDRLQFKLIVNGKTVTPEVERKVSDCGSHGEIECLDIKLYWTQIFPKEGTLAVEHHYNPYPAAGTLVENAEDLKRSKQTYCLSDDFMTRFGQLKKNLETELMKRKPEDQPLGMKGLTQAMLDQQSAESRVSTALHYGGAIGIDYILKTGANWAGPIRDFTLTLIAEDPKDLMSTCFPDLKEVSPLERSFHAKNYKPKKDLSILYVFASPKPGKI